MGLLLDTHAFLWFAEDSPRLSPTARDMIRRESEVFVSMASIWELGIKQSLGRFGIPDEEFGDLIAD
jgi:PIN domain nuclease of toxin-antitoxin system